MKTALCRWVTRAVWKTPETQVRRVLTTHLAGKVLGCTTLCMTLAKCEGALEAWNSKADNLTREQCIKQACLLSVNSATTLLTTTSLALLDICKEYKDSLTRMLSLLEELQTLQGENPALWDEIVEARATVNKAKAAVTELNIYMTTVEKVVNSTTEAAFLAGAEYMCTVLCERLYSAQKEISNKIAEIKELEEEYIKVQKEIVLAKNKDNKESKESKEKVKDKPNVDVTNVKQLLH